jgi:ribonuclease HI
MSDTATMHIDGAARGNPGPAAYAIVLARPGEPVVEEADTIGTATNNVAEYTALLRGLELAVELGVKKIAVFSDSELMVKQMNGEYRVKNADLLPLYEEAKRLQKQVGAVTLSHVRREKNARADALGNRALDGKPHRRGEPAPVETPAVRATEPAQSVSVDTVREDAIACLEAAAKEWASRGVAKLPPAAVWEQLWSILTDAGLVKKRKK